MSFQTRQLLVYFAFILVLVVILGFGFYGYNTRVLEDNAMSTQSVMAEQMVQQLDNLVRPMDFISTYFLSISNILRSINVLSRIDRNLEGNPYYVNEARMALKSALLSYSFDKSFYRVNIITRTDFFSSNFLTPSVGDTDAAARIKTITWYAKAEEAKGKVVLLAPFTDPWGTDPRVGKPVFALVRAVQGGGSGLGYVEVQRAAEELQRVFAVPEPDSMRVLALSSTGDILFHSQEYTAAQLGEDLVDIAKGRSKPAIRQNRLTGKDELVSINGSDYSGVTILLARNKSALLKPVTLAGNLTLGICLTILLLSLLYIYIFSKQLTKPIRLLKQQMEETELQNLPDQLQPLISNNEVEALSQSFGNLRERLNEAVRQEIQAHSLQLQANFDSLQAQVNPHFLFNILNVLSHRGLVNGDDEICEICDGIAGMLRYSTSTSTRSATVEEELNHVRNYLLLMKKRLEHKLEYDITVEESLLQEPIPKIVLQQMVENSLSHGFPQGGSVMRVEISGWRTEDGWEIVVTDNGQGFSMDKLKSLQLSLEQMRRDLDGQHIPTGMGIGGMGIVNTYARLHVFYQGQERFELGNREHGGARIVLGTTQRSNGGSKG